MHVLLFEAGLGGHAFMYVRLLLPALVDLCDRVTVLMHAEAPGRPGFDGAVGALRDGVEVISSVEGRVSTLADASDRARALREQMRRLGPDHVLATTLDGTIQGMGALAGARRAGAMRSAPIEGVLHNCRFAYPSSGVAARLRAAGVRRLCVAAPVERLHLVDLLAYEAIRRRGGSLAARAAMLPDPIEPGAPMEMHEARRRLGAPEGGRLLSCPGALSRRKGVDLLLGAFGAARLGAEDRLLLAGRLAPEVRSALDALPEQSRRRVIAMDRYVTDEEFGLALAAADVVCAPYPAHAGISNIALRACAAGRPVLASDYGWLGRITMQFGLGWTCDVRSPEAFARGIERALEAAPGFRHDERAERLMAFHTVENFRASFTAGLRRRMELDDAPGRRDWSWVVGQGGV